jgi:hypothetical protein
VPATHARPTQPPLRLAATVAAWCAGGLALLGWGGGGAPAHAQLIRELVPLVSVGVTDNADASRDTRRRDEFGTAAITARVRYQGARANHALANHLSFTHFFEGVGFDNVTDSLSWISAFDLSATLQLRLLANVALSRGSGVDPGDLSAVVPTAVRSGTNWFLTAGGGEELAYKPTPLRTYSESLNVSQVHYFAVPMGATVRTTTVIAGAMHAEWAAARDTLIADARLADAYVPRNPLLPGDPGAGHNLLGQLLLGWRRELSVRWSSELQAGVLVIFKTNGDGVAAPAGLASLTYKGVPWFATLVVSQSPAPNLYIGESTISDQVLLRLALPLNRRETFLLAGYAGYVYARIVTDASGDLTRGYDQFSGGGSLLARSQQHPFWASLSVLFIDQRGSTMDGTYIPDLLARTVLLSVGAAFAFGPGTPSVFSGAL